MVFEVFEAEVRVELPLDKVLFELKRKHTLREVFELWGDEEEKLDFAKWINESWEGGE